MEAAEQHAGRDLRDIQLTELGILLDFRKTCEEHGFHYYFTGGTLLGAVRHKGFIPWDDDIDLLMPREDFERFSRLCLSGQARGFVFQSTRTDANYPHYFAKLKPQMSAGQSGGFNGFIDIFPMDVCPEKDGLAKLFFKSVELCNTALFMRTLEGFTCGYTKGYMRFLAFALSKCPNRFLVALQNAFRRFFGCFSSGTRLCNVGGRYKFPGEAYEAAWFSRPAELEFEGHGFSVPCGWHEMLTNMYGDYMTPPDEAERTGHSEMS